MPAKAPASPVVSAPSSSESTGSVSSVSAAAPKDFIVITRKDSDSPFKVPVSQKLEEPHEPLIDDSIKLRTTLLTIINILQISTTLSLSLNHHAKVCSKHELTSLQIAVNLVHRGTSEMPLAEWVEARKVKAATASSRVSAAAASPSAAIYDPSIRVNSTSIIDPNTLFTTPTLPSSNHEAILRSSIKENIELLKDCAGKTRLLHFISACKKDYLHTLNALFLEHQRVNKDFPIEELGYQDVEKWIEKRTALANLAKPAFGAFVYGNKR